MLLEQTAHVREREEFALKYVSYPTESLRAKLNSLKAELDAHPQPLSNAYGSLYRRYEAVRAELAARGVICPFIQHPNAIRAQRIVSDRRNNA